MKVQVAKWGNSAAVRLPKAIVDELSLTPGQTLELRRNGSKIEIETSLCVQGIPVYRLEDIVAEMKRLGPENEPETVDWGPDRGSEIIDDEYSRPKRAPRRG